MWEADRLIAADLNDQARQWFQQQKRAIEQDEILRAIGDWNQRLRG